ncbi:MAG: hypothetical protein ACYCSG_00295 [Thermoplasmataceae archaeon]
MKEVKSYLNIDTVKGKMHSLLESAKKRKRTTFALVAAIVMIGSVGLYITYSHSTQYHSGIPVNISVKFTGTPPGMAPFVNGSTNARAYYNSQNVFFSLISDIPMGLNLTPEGKLVNMTNVNMTNNPYVVSLMIGRGSSNGNFSSYLGTNLFNIARQWRASGISNQSEVSVMLQAEYSFIVNGTIYEYRYYNNIVYSPFNAVFNDMQAFKTSINAPSISLKSKIFFNLSHPSYVGPFNITLLHHKRLLSKAHTGGIIGTPGGNCGPNSYYPDCCPNYYKTNGTIVQAITEKSWTGILPLAIATMKLPSNSDFTATFFENEAITNMNFNTAEACEVNNANTQIMDSTSASFTSGSMTSVGATLFAHTHGTGGSNQSIAYLPSVTFTATEYRDAYPEDVYVSGRWYCGVSYGVPYTVLAVKSLTTNVPQVSYLYSIANNSNTGTTTSIWQSVINSLGLTETYSGTLNSNAQISGASFSQYTTEYNNAKSKMAEINDAMGTFTAALGVALAINAATGLIPGAATADDVVNGIALSAAEVGLASSIITDMSSISIQVSTNVHLNEFVLANSPPSSTGSTLSYQMFQSVGSTPIFFISNSGNTYNFNAPVDYFEVTPTS